MYLGSINLLLLLASAIDAARLADGSREGNSLLPLAWAYEAYPLWSLESAQMPMRHCFDRVQRQSKDIIQGASTEYRKRGGKI